LNLQISFVSGKLPSLFEWKNVFSLWLIVKSSWTDKRNP
jgi:hypothetical protein